MAIIVRNMAKIELAPEFRSYILSMYTYSSREKHFKNYKYKDGIAYLPLNMDKLKRVAAITGQEIVDERIKGEVVKEYELNPQFKLRSYQEKPTEDLLNYILEHKYGVLRAACGAGKTIVMSYVAGQLERKILILVDMSSLVSQWMAAFETVYNLKAQLIDSKTTSFSNVCIATFQLLHQNKELLLRIKDEFGCLLVDEFHTSQAETYKEVLFKLNNEYRIGCTATFMRKNFDQNYLADLISSVSVEMVDPNALSCEVLFVQTGVEFYSNNPDDWGKIQSRLAKSDLRNKAIAHLTIQACKQGKRVAVIGITQDSLLFIETMLKTCPECKPKVYIGTTTLKQDLQLKEDMSSGKINCVLSVKKLDKGLDIPSLDYLILAKPLNNEAAIVQLSGRIVRSEEGKGTPRVIDLVDKSDLARRFASNRKKWYLKLGYYITQDLT